VVVGRGCEHRRKARDSNPHAHKGALFSREARRTVSGCLPFRTGINVVEWTGRGVEPRSPGCKPGVFPLDQPPICDRVERWSAWPGRRIRPASDKVSMSSRRESNPPFLFVREESYRWTTGRSCHEQRHDAGRIEPGSSGSRMEARLALESQAPVTIREGRPYESRLGTRHAWVDRESWPAFAFLLQQPGRESNPSFHSERVAS
jgi:hypothetical protein